MSHHMTHHMTHHAAGLTRPLVPVLALTILSLAVLVSCSTAVDWGKGKAADAAAAKSDALAAEVEEAVPDLDADAGAVEGVKAIVAAAVREVAETGDLRGTVDTYLPVAGKFFGALLLGLVSAWLGGRNPRRALVGVTEAIERSGDAAPGIKARVASSTSALGIGGWLHDFLRTQKIS